MGFNGSSDQGMGSRKQGGQESTMRDTLGFLKKSEEEKKRKEEEKRQASSQKDAAYKLLSEVPHNLAGYESNTNYPYSTGPSLPASVRQQLKQYMKIENISQSESGEIKRLLFKSASAGFHDSWH